MGVGRDENEKIGQSQFYDLITGEELSWQAIIYDLIKTEQLDPWDIDVGVLADKYVIVIQEIEEANFFVSSKVLLACSLLLRLKSDILLNRYIRDLDAALYGRKEEKKYEMERIEIDERDLPILVPRTPMPRYKKVTIKELMSALNLAIETEDRRVRKEIRNKEAERAGLVVLPKKNRVPLRTRIKDLLARIRVHLKHPDNIHMKFSELAPSREEKLSAFVPVLHLSNQKKLWLKQENHFDEIYMTLERLEEEVQELKRVLGGVEDIDV